jgi:Tfp pilus assembly protein PilO
MKLTSRDKKFIIAGTVVLCVFVLIKFLLFPFYDKIEQEKKDIQLKERTLEKYLTFIQKQAELQQTLKGLSKEERTIQRSLLKGETPSLAAADLQKIVDKTAETSGLNIKSVKVLEPGEKEGFVTIPIQVMFSSDLTRMKKFIHGLETNRKLLTIPQLKIRVKNKRKPREISVTLQILGLMRKEDLNT